MKHLLVLMSFLCFIPFSNAQIADGKIAPNFDVTDLDGNDHELEDYLNDGKHMILDFSATWCGPCWNYHNTGILDELYNDYGPNGTNELMVLFMEGDGGTNDNCCYGFVGCDGGTWGNWTTHDYPVVNLTGSDLSVVGAYQIAYWPTLFIVNAEHKTVWEVGQASINGWEQVLFESFTLEAEVTLIPGECDLGTIEVEADGGSGNLSYEWSNGETGTSIQVESGYYDLTVMDAIGYFVEFEDIFLDNEGAEFEIDDEEIINVSCNGGDDGSIYVDVDSNDDIDYTWSNGEDDQYNDDLESGMYYLTIFNNDNGCFIELEYELEEPEELELELTASGTTCGAENGSLSMEAFGGSGDMLYDYGEGYTEDDYAEDLPAGEYTVYVKDENGCTEHKDIVIGGSEALSAGLLGVDNLTCVQTELLISLEANTPNNLEYIWSNNSGDVISTESSVNIATAGIYNVAIVDVETLCDFDSTFEIASDFSLPEFELENIQTLSCENLSFEAAYSAMEPGAYISTWSYTDENGDTQSVESATLLIESAGTYTLSLSNIENGCVTEQSFDVEFEDNYPVSNFSYELDAATLFLESLAGGENLNETWTVDGENVSLSEDGSIEFVENGTYAVCLTVENECGASSYCEDIEVSGIISGLIDLDIEGIDIRSFGNTILIDNQFKALDQAELAVFNLTSSLVKEQIIDLPFGISQFEFESVVSGIYIIRLNTGAETEAQKLFLSK